MTDKVKFYNQPLNYNKHALATPDTFLIYLIGDKSKEAYGWGESETWGGIVAKANEIVSPSIDTDYKPLILTKDHLKNINNVKLADDKHKKFLFFQCGEVTDLDKLNLTRNLAKNTNSMKSGDSQYYYCDGENSTYNGTEIFTYNKPYENLNENGIFERIASGNDPLGDVISTVNQKLGVAEGVPEEYSTYSEYFNKGLMDSQRCDEILNWHKGNIRKANGGYYKFNGRTWEQLDYESGLTGMVLEFLDVKEVRYSNALLKNVTNLLHSKLKTLGTPKSHLMAFNNGVLNKQTGELLQYNKEHCLTTINSCDYWVNDGHPTTPFFDKVINQASKGDKERADFFEAMLFHLAFLPNDFDYFYELSGEAGAGKSTIIDIAIMLVGKHNATPIKLRHFADKHGLTNIADKRLLYSYDDNPERTNTDTLKSVVSGETIPVNPKGKDYIDITPHCAFIFGTNHAKEIKDLKGDTDKGIRRRLVIVHFDKVINDSDKIPQLKEKLKLECGGILWKLLNKFKDNPKRAEKLIKKQRDGRDSVLVKVNSEKLAKFAECFEVIEWKSGLHVKKQGGLKFSCKVDHNDIDRNNSRNNAIYKSIFRAYRYWHECDENNKKADGKKEFKESLENVFASLGTPIRIERVLGQWYTNLKWKDDPIEIVNSWEN